MKLAPCVEAAWASERLSIDDATAKQIGASLSGSNPRWGGVNNKATFAAAYLDGFLKDPSIGLKCRGVVGKDSPPLFAIPAEVAKMAPDGAGAKELLGVFVEAARMRAGKGSRKEAIEHAAVELLEFGQYAESAFELAKEIQHVKAYKDLVDMAQSVEQVSWANSLVDEGIEPAEAAVEARSKVRRSYSVALLATLAVKAAELEASEKQVRALQETASCLAAAARSSAVHIQISTAPLGTGSALAVLDESITSIEERLKGSEDENLIRQAKECKEAVAACEKQLIGRAEACSARLLAREVRTLALESSSQIAEAEGIGAKGPADATKMEELLSRANELALKACERTLECAKLISSQPRADSNDKEARALLNSIELAFNGASGGARSDAASAPGPKKPSAPTPAPAPADTKAAATPEADPADAKAAAAPAADPEADDAGAAARQALLTALEKFSSKRWDTNMAVQTLKRLTDRRKEVIGQLWESVEGDSPDALRRAEKFVDQFRNAMDARRRLDAVVRLIGRGRAMDVRTAKWFIDSILEISALAKAYCEANGVEVSYTASIA